MKMDDANPLTLALLGLFVVVIMGMLTSSRHAELKREQARINQKLDLVMKHLGIELPAPPLPGYVPPDLLPQIRDLIRTRKKVNAIKLLREHTGLSLLDAKNTIEGLERRI
jgi:hypothetical protein